MSFFGARAGRFRFNLRVRVRLGARVQLRRLVDPRVHQVRESLARALCMRRRQQMQPPTTHQHEAKPRKPATQSSYGHADSLATETAIPQCRCARLGEHLLRMQSLRR